MASDGEQGTRGLHGSGAVAFSTRGEYGVRFMVALARMDHGEPVSLTDIAEAEDLPRAYLEQIIGSLRDAGIIDSARGDDPGAEHRDRRHVVGAVASAPVPFHARHHVELAAAGDLARRLSRQRPRPHLDGGRPRPRPLVRFPDHALGTRAEVRSRPLRHRVPATSPCAAADGCGAAE